MGTESNKGWGWKVTEGWNGKWQKDGTESKVRMGTESENRMERKELLAIFRSIWNHEKKCHVGHVCEGTLKLLGLCAACSCVNFMLLLSYHPSSSLWCPGTMFLRISKIRFHIFNMWKVSKWKRLKGYWSLNIKKSMIYHILSYHQNYRVIYNPAAFSCFPHGHELQDELLVCCGVSISIPTLLQSLCCIHFSQKYVSIHALECNDMDCFIYMNHFAEMISDPAMVMFVNEAAKNKKIPSCKMGWSLKGR